MEYIIVKAHEIGKQGGVKLLVNPSFVVCQLPSPNITNGTKIVTSNEGIESIKSAGFNIDPASILLAN